MTDEGDELEPALRRALATYRVPDCGDLTGGVASRIAARRGHWGLGVAAVAVIAIAIAGFAARPAATHDGRHSAKTRETIELGARGKAVAEPGAELRWHVDGSAARVEQLAGAVFYRVEAGGAFVVATPAGVVEVKGTCFRVEVEPMKPSRNQLITAGAAAVVAAAIVVVVYEGRVRVVAQSGTTELAAGESIRLDPGATTPDGGAVAGLARLGARTSQAELTGANAALHDELAAANARIAKLEGQIAELHAGPGETTAVDPTPEQLKTWAERCEIHIDAPGLFGATTGLPDKVAKDWGVTKAEQPILEHALAELHDGTRNEMRDIYLAATGNATVADEVTAGSMLSEIFDKALPADKLRARQRLARERAGLQAPPELAAQSPFERALRLLARLGNDYETLVAEGLGAKRTRELRKRYEAWPGMRLDDKGCD